MKNSATILIKDLPRPGQNYKAVLEAFSFGTGSGELIGVGGGSTNQQKKIESLTIVLKMDGDFFPLLQAAVDSTIIEKASLIVISQTETNLLQQRTVFDFVNLYANGYPSVNRLSIEFHFEKVSWTLSASDPSPDVNVNRVKTADRHTKAMNAYLRG